MRNFYQDIGKIKIAFWLALSFLLLPTQNCLHAQSIRINAVAPPEGKTFVHITGIVQDKQGYMWFGSKKGLYRYDGYNFITYKNDPLNLNSLGSNSLESLAIDSTGMLWIGTFGGGLDRLDPVTENFTHFHHEAANEGSFSSDTILAILPDSKGILWVGTPSRLDQFDPATNKFKHYSHDTNDPFSLSCNEVRTIYEDREGTIWIGTGSPYPNDKSPAEDGGLNKLDSKTGKFTRYLHRPGDPHSLINNKVGAILEDTKGNFWIGTAGDGLHTMDRATGSFQRHEYDPTSPEKLSRPPLSKAYPWDHIRFIKEDASGAIWIGTSDAGMNRYDTRTKKIKHYESTLKSEWLGGTFDDQTSWAAFSSRDGIFWISTITGHLLRIDPFDRNLPFIAVGDKVSTLYEEPVGLVWIGAENQLILRDDKSGKETTPYPNTWYSKIFEDKQENIWIATADGLYMTDKKRQHITSYLHDEKDLKTISDNVVLSIHEDSRSNIWVGTLRGLDVLNKNGTFIHYKPFPKDSDRFGQNIVTSILEDKEGKLWAGSNGAGGVHQLNRANGSFKNYLNGTEIRSLYQDSAGQVWVAANDGLYAYNASSDIFTRFIDPSSPRGIENVRSVIEDNDRNLWIGTDDGIVKLNVQRNETTLFGKNYNVESLTNGSAYKNKDGKLYFGTSTGYYFFDPRQLKSSSKSPQVILSAFRIADKLVKPGNNSPITASLFTTSEIRLPYYQNVFSIDFIAIDYTNPQDNRYLFMLENYDKTWHQAGSDRRASFYNVPPGKYIFKVKAANSDGLWTEKDLSIVITPPWWRTWWAYCIYGLLFILAAYGFHRFQQEKVIRAERERSRTKELVQAKEIEKAYNELKTTQAQLVQSEKMASLGELTAGIAHEIQNPLNFVNNFSEVNSELIEELKTCLSGRQVKNEKLEIDDKEINALLSDIYQNNDKISIHGKRADAIVKGMLQHSRMSTGQKEMTDINAFVDEYLRLAYHGLRAKDKSFNTVVIKTDFDSSIGKINIVPQDISRVILNLINNAFYAVNEKASLRPANYEPLVAVGTKKLKDQVTITVKDNGNGIPQRNLEKIFQPFFTTKPAGQGTGLGLSLAYDIVKAHGGEIKVETREGEGSEFLIILPMPGIS